LFSYSACDFLLEAREVLKAFIWWFESALRGILSESKNGSEHRDDVVPQAPCDWPGGYLLRFDPA
jgi:hypothetical protein